MRSSRYLSIILPLIYFFIASTLAAADQPPCEVSISARQVKGYVSGSARIYKKREWEEAGIQKIDWNLVKEKDLRKGTTSFNIIPGIYKVRLYVGGTSQETEEFSLEGTQESHFAFEISTVNIGVRQAKGYVSGSARIYKKREWEEAGIHKVDWNLVKEKDLRKGTTSFNTIPGIYKLRLYVGGTSQETEEFSLKGTQESDFAFQVSTVNIGVRQAKGYVSGSTRIYKKREWEEAGIHKVDWNLVKEKDLRKGTTSFNIIPGIYKLRLYVGGTSQETEEFSLEGTQESDFAFEISMVNIGVRQAKGYVSGSTRIYKKREWEEAGIQKVDWNLVKEKDLRKGTTSFNIIPGIYKVRLYVGGTSQETEEFSLEGTQESDFAFQVSTVNIGARQAKGYVSGSTRIYKKREWEEAGIQKVDWNLVKEKDLRKGTTSFTVIPGTYRVRLYSRGIEGYMESKSLLPQSTEEITVSFLLENMEVAYSHDNINEISPSSKPIPKEEAAKPQYSKKSVVDILLDASLIGAGIDPGTDLAIKAKKLSKDTLNPLKPAEELQRDIDAIVEEVRKKQ